MFNLPSGNSWDQPFTLRAKPGEAVTIQGSGETNMYIASGIEYYSVLMASYSMAAIPRELRSSSAVAVTRNPVL
jgi:hypothetical protein